MRGGIFSPILLAAGVFATPALAEQQGPGEALQLLQKVSTAAQRLNYTGVFVYQNGNHSETSRITHAIQDGNEFERLEVLNGSPREVVRANDEVRCFLPDNKLLIVERRNTRQFFPTLLPGNLAGLTEYYVIRAGSIERVAGINGRVVQVEPRDEFRYGHRFWIDPQTGLLLKASMVGEAAAQIETFAFTEVKIGGPITREMLMPQMAKNTGDWHVERVVSSDVRADDGQWLFRNGLPGFRRMSGTKRQLRPDAPESTQVIFSDGLAAISVFLEPLAGRNKEDPSSFSMGAVNVYKRQVPGYQVIVMGDVPMAALHWFGEGIEPKKK
jgi:sigma-E factor negative regulatory protein RseB